MLRLPLEHVSLKTQTGPPGDEPADLDLPYWAGLLPLTSGAGVPEPAPDLPSTIATPSRVTTWARPTRAAG